MTDDLSPTATAAASTDDAVHKKEPGTLFTKQTKSVVWGMQTRAVQGMLDFDYVCSRNAPSVVAMIYPFV